MLAVQPQATIQKQNHHSQGQPRKSSDNSGVRLLRRVCQEIWQPKCLEVFQWYIWLPSLVRDCQYLAVLFAWRVVAAHSNCRRNQKTWERRRHSLLRTSMRSAMVWPRRSNRLGHISERRWVYLWFWSICKFQSCQLFQKNHSGPSADKWRVQHTT